MNDITKTNGNAIAFPSDFADQLSSGIAESRATTVLAGGGKSLLRMGKDGVWIFGQENEEVIEGSRWIVNIMTLAHGYCCWVDGGKDKNQLAGEVMVSMTKPKPARPEPIQGTPFAEQRSFELKCLDGEDAGLELLYKTASVGGMRGVDALLAEIQGALVKYRQQPEGSTAYVFPIVELLSDSYNHTKWGKIYNPILDIVGWADTDGNIYGQQPAVQEAAKRAPVEQLAQQPEAPPAPARARRAAAPRQAPQAAPAPAEPVSTQQAHVGQRRRPAAR